MQTKDYLIVLSIWIISANFLDYDKIFKNVKINDLQVQESNPKLISLFQGLSLPLLIPHSKKHLLVCGGREPDP